MTRRDDMAAFEFSDGAIAIDAAIVAEGLAIAPQALLQALRESAITSRCESGVDADSGRYRLTFFSKHRRFRVVVGVHLIRRIHDLLRVSIRGSRHFDKMLSHQRTKPVFLLSHGSLLLVGYCYDDGWIRDGFDDFRRRRRFDF